MSAPRKPAARRRPLRVHKPVVRRYEHALDLSTFGRKDALLHLSRDGNSTLCGRRVAFTITEAEAKDFDNACERCRQVEVYESRPALAPKGDASPKLDVSKG